MITESKENLTISRKTKGKLPSLPFSQIKNDILGKRFKLDISFIEKKTIKVKLINES